MDIDAILKLVRIAANLAETLTPHVQMVIADLNEDDTAILKADLAKIQTLNDATFDRVQAKLAAAAQEG